MLDPHALPRQVALAILYQRDTRGELRFLMQLRDDIPTIVHPGCWGFFGGQIEAGETPQVAMRRELLEEIGYAPPQLTKFGDYGDEAIARHVFAGVVTVEKESLVLGEGWDLDFFTVEQVRLGKAFSAKSGDVRPLIPTVRQILLDFLERESRS